MTDNKLADALRELSGKWRSWAEELKRTGQAVVPNSYKAVADELDAALAEHDAKAAANGEAADAIEKWMDENWLQWRNDPCSPHVTRLRRVWNAAKAAASDAPAPVPPPAPEPHGEFSLHDRIEFALRDAGFDLDEASRLAIAALQQPVTLREVTDRPHVMRPNHKLGGMVCDVCGRGEVAAAMYSCNPTRFGV